MKMARVEHDCFVFNKGRLKVIYQQRYLIGDFKIILQNRFSRFIFP
jgi:hypothetical protein